MTNDLKLLLEKYGELGRNAKMPFVTATTDSLNNTPPIYLIFIIYFVATRIKQTKIRYTVIIMFRTT
jgi:hypothetical protein